MRDPRIQFSYHMVDSKDVKKFEELNDYAPLHRWLRLWWKKLEEVNKNFSYEKPIKLPRLPATRKLVTEAGEISNQLTEFFESFECWVKREKQGQTGFDEISEI